MELIPILIALKSLSHVDYLFSLLPISSAGYNPSFFLSHSVLYSTLFPLLCSQPHHIIYLLFYHTVLAIFGYQSINWF